MRVALKQDTRQAWRRLREPTDEIALYVFAVVIPIVVLLQVLNLWSKVPDIVLVSTLFLGALWLWTLRALRLGVYVGEQGLRIVNPGKTWRVRWSEVGDVSSGYPEGRWRTDQPVLTTTSGQRIPLTAIMAPQPWTRPNNDFAETALKTLSSYLDTARANGFRLEPSTIR